MLIIFLCLHFPFLNILPLFVISIKSFFCSFHCLSHSSTSCVFFSSCLLLHRSLSYFSCNLLSSFPLRSIALCLVLLYLSNAIFFIHILIMGVKMDMLSILMTRKQLYYYYSFLSGAPEEVLTKSSFRIIFRCDKLQESEVQEGAQCPCKSNALLEFE